MRFQPALKDKTMKYPRAANGALDVGMLLMFVSVLPILIFTFGSYDDAIFFAAICLLVADNICLAASKFIASINVVQPEQSTPTTAVHLKRV